MDVRTIRLLATGLYAIAIVILALLDAGKVLVIVAVAGGMAIGLLYATTGRSMAAQDGGRQRDRAGRRARRSGR